MRITGSVKRIIAISDELIMIFPNSLRYLMLRILFVDIIIIMLILYIIIGIVLTGLILIRVMLVRRGGHSFPWLQFYIRGKEASFRIGEINNLQRLVIKTKLRDPLAVYWSQKAVLSCVKYVDKQYHQDEVLEDAHEARFMRKLYDLLNHVTRSSQEKKRGLQNTRELDANMPIDMFHKNKQYKSQIIEVQNRYIAVAHPRALKAAEGVAFVAGEQVSIQLWRRGDSGYNFSSRLLNVHDESVGILYIQHTRKINRAQARSLMRKEINKSGLLFLLSDVKGALDSDDERDESGLRCQILDLSEGGVSVLIGGKVSDQLGFKVKIRVGAVSVVMVARLIHSDYHSDKDVSLLRLKAMNKSMVMRNRISAVVYGIGVDRTDDAEEEGRSETNKEK